MGAGMAGKARRKRPTRRARAIRRPPQRSLRRRLRRAGLIAVAVLLVGPALLIALYRFVDPPITPLMLIRAGEGYARWHDWVPAAAIAPGLAHAVIAAEDNRFCRHGGFDWQALGTAWRDWRTGGRLRGASTITQQTAKNLFLWPGRDWLRKTLEAWLTWQIELIWPKPRILEVYLNIVEWGPGVYGAEAAAQFHFAQSAARLSRRQAALLATALPDPLTRAAGQPQADHDRRARRIEQRLHEITPWLDCVETTFGER